MTRNPTDKDKRRALRAAMKQIEDNRAALLACTKGFMTTKPDQELLLAAAKAVAEATAKLLKQSRGQADAERRRVLGEGQNAARCQPAPRSVGRPAARDPQEHQDHCVRVG